MKKKHCGNEAGFSLVELAIVIIIIGLLIVSVVAGKNLIDASRIRSAINEVETIQGAIVRFEEKYFSLPGDMPDADAYWDAAPCGTNPSTACDGDGNELVVWSTGGGKNEGALAFAHLQLANMLGGDPLTGLGAQALPGDNIPTSNVPNAGFMADSGGVLGANFLRLGAIGTTDINDTPVLTPDAAESIDSKMDDGLPNSGRVQAEQPVGTTCFSGAVWSDEDIVACTMVFQLANDL